MQYSVSERSNSLFICTGVRDEGAMRARCVRLDHAAQFHAGYQLDCTMGDWSMFDADWPTRPYEYNYPYPYYDYQEKEQPQAQLLEELSSSLPFASSLPQEPPMSQSNQPNRMISPRNKATPRGDNPREIRNKAEKQRRDKLNQSIAELAAMVPPVVASSRKIDKTGVLRLTAHYLRAHQYVFGESIHTECDDFKQSTADSVLNLLNGFLLTTTYRGLVVVVSQNMTQYLGYSELDLFGQSLFSITHEDDHNLLREQLMPQLHLLGPNGELLVPDEPSGKKMVEETLAKDQRRFVVRFKKHGQRSEPPQYVTCHIEGSFRKSDRACRGYNRCCQVVRRARARSDNPCSSGNDVVFIGVVRPTVDTFVNESRLESFRMEYRTRHSIDGEIVQCEQRIALVTGYMTHEVNGVNAMNFMHKDDVQWVIIALREMYVKKRLFGESCYRLMTKNGQFIYMRTRGCLDVDKDSRAVTTFVCTNTVVGEKEGKHLIKLMKKKFMLTVNNNEKQNILLNAETNEDSNDYIGVKDPRLLEKDILHLVTDLPSSSSGNPINQDDNGDLSHSLTLIPPKKERIVSAIEKMYTVIKNFPRESSVELKETSPSLSLDSLNQATQTDKFLKPAIPSIVKNPSYNKPSSFEDTFMPQSLQSDFEENIPTTAIIDVDNYVFEDESHNNPKQELCKGKTNTRYTNTGPRPDHQTVTGVRNKRQMKRSIESLGCETNLKKKSNESKEDSQNSETSSTNFETLLDEAISSAEFIQLDTALQSLEQTIDPTFPNLLSNEVQDILGEIEEDPVKGQRNK